jgi:hypothetical protein
MGGTPDDPNLASRTRTTAATERVRQSSAFRLALGVRARLVVP